METKLIPTAEEFLATSDEFEVIETRKQEEVVTKAMIEFAKLHVEAALKEAKNSLKDGYVTPQDEQDILNAYPLTNIK